MADGIRDRERGPDAAPTRSGLKSGHSWGVQIVLGALVVVAGVLLLLDTVLPAQIPAVAWSIVLVGGSAAFGFAFVAYPAWWWAAIPAGALLGAASVPVMELDSVGAQWTEVPFLTALGGGFWAVYLKDHRRWWAVIPGGVLLTLALMAGVTGAVGAAMTGAVFMFGLAVTFALVAALPTGRSRHRWAWIAAGVLAAAGIIVVLQSAELLMLLAYAWPIAVIGGGAYLLVSAVRRRRATHRTAPAAAAGVSGAGDVPDRASPSEDTYPA
jgi:hypothetical protein